MSGTSGTAAGRRLRALAAHAIGTAQQQPAAAAAQDPDDAVTLANGVVMPLTGFGTGIGAADVEKHDGENQYAVTVAAVNTALDCGYVAIDTAQRYGTEPPIGEVLAERFAAGLSRDDVFVTTKVANPRPAPAGMLPGGGLKYMLQPELSAYEGVLDEFRGCLENLQLDAVDLLLIHFPGPPHTDNASLSPELSQKKRLEAWRALETIYEEGRAKAIGVSNYCVRHLEELIGVAKVMPMVNQVELHTRLAQPELRAWCTEHSIVMTAYSPLSGADLADPVIAEIAERHGVSPAVVVLRWLRQHNCVVLPKSLTPQRIADNLALPRSFALSEEEMQQMDGLDEGKRVNADAELIV